MLVCIVVFDQFTDIDVFLPWDLLNRVKKSDWKVQLVGESAHHTSMTGLTIPMHGPLAVANDADAVLFASGPGARKKMTDPEFLKVFRLDPEKQLIGSMCSGALLLAALGLLEGREATTYPTTKFLLEGFAVKVVEKPFVQEGNIATAAGCLAT